MTAAKLTAKLLDEKFQFLIGAMTVCEERTNILSDLGFNSL